jgi:cytochrome bd-type quinol oxidase subunit 2
LLPAPRQVYVFGSLKSDVFRGVAARPRRGSPQGVVLGTFIQRVIGREFSGSSFDWVTPFALLTGVALMFGYALLGRCLGGAEDGIRDRARL